LNPDYHPHTDSPDTPHPIQCATNRLAFPVTGPASWSPHPARSQPLWREKHLGQHRAGKPGRPRYPFRQSPDHLLRPDHGPKGAGNLQGR